MDNKTMILHIGVLNALVLSMFISTVQRDPELAREIVDMLEDISDLPWGAQSYAAEDMKLLQETVDDILDPIRKALGVPPGKRSSGGRRLS